MQKLPETFFCAVSNIGQSTLKAYFTLKDACEIFHVAWKVDLEALWYGDYS